MTTAERIKQILVHFTLKHGILASSVILEQYAEELVKNGAIFPPCKVGDKTFLLLEKMRGGYDILESKCVAISENIFIKVYSMFIDCAEISNTLEYKLEDFGRWVFLTKEEAEKALERSENGT